MAEKNVLVSTTHHHSWELSTPIWNTSAATVVTIKYVQKLHPLERLSLQIHTFWFAIVLQRSEQVQQLRNHTEAKQRQNVRHPEGVRRLPGSSVWPVDHRSWNRKLKKIQRSSPSDRTLRDTILLPPGSHLKLDSRGPGREAAVPSPPQRWAPGRSQKLQPLPDQMTLPQLDHHRLRCYQAHTCGSQWASVCLKSPNCCWFPDVQSLSLNHCKGD